MTGPAVQHILPTVVPNTPQRSNVGGSFRSVLLSGYRRRGWGHRKGAKARPENMQLPFLAVSVNASPYLTHFDRNFHVMCTVSLGAS
eukprot:4577471-Amphidinium_carterae.1